MIDHAIAAASRRRLVWPGFLATLLLAACAQPGADARASGGAQLDPAVSSIAVGRASPAAPAQAAASTKSTHAEAKPEGIQTAIFAGGCFWCMEPPYDTLPGVISTESGYIGGTVANPTYEQVSAGRTRHAEALRVTYDPARVDYPKLLEVFWRNIDPVAVDRQFCDVGNQYRSAIFPVNDEQRRIAEASKKTLQADPRFRQQTIATRIEPTATFYPAESYHQDYYRKNPVRYKYYRYSCGRDRRLEEIWGEAG
ncbi:peptide-methionine (S)-S-oxide reductase MsrA [Lysobacter sp. A03]|uniref:peptide-methionine (S)-S-oxide reductase MsrA n=1 Tax=Lysobacter sp. A03 TaxID=1199154 RepID=UPI0005B727EE|nr:peptide-methionine (S)-S-oxide reductase MsrA [Lysobacter sp. A03]KIQ96401.1 Peptide methionine sulfoxide reductase MsrA [Lysobacter sp. A03]